MAASLTKEQLKNELISHGVQPPLQSARKEEFVKLYEQHVAPIVAQKGDFSSDEETDASLDTKVPAQNNSLVSDGVDVSALSDEELFEKLQGFGIPVGPIVESTRGLYQRKLAALLQNGLPKESEKTNGEGTPKEDKFSDSEDEQEVEEPEQVQAAVEPEAAVPEEEPLPSAPAPEPAVSTPEPLTSVRKRNVDRPPSSLNALPLVDRQGTPTPRPSIRSVTGSSNYSFESRRLLDTTDGKEALLSDSPSPSQKNVTRYVLIAIILALVLFILFLYADQLMPLVESVKSSLFKYVEKAEEVAEKIDHAKPNLLDQ